MSLFQSSVLNKYLGQQDTVQVQKQKKAFDIKSQFVADDKKNRCYGYALYGMSVEKIMILENY